MNLQDLDRLADHWGAAIVVVGLGFVCLTIFIQGFWIIGLTVLIAIILAAIALYPRLARLRDRRP